MLKEISSRPKYSKKSCPDQNAQRFSATTKILKNIHSWPKKHESFHPRPKHSKISSHHQNTQTFPVTTKILKDFLLRPKYSKISCHGPNAPTMPKIARFGGRTAKKWSGGVKNDYKLTWRWGFMPKHRRLTEISRIYKNIKTLSLGGGGNGKNFVPEM